MKERVRQDGGFGMVNTHAKYLGTHSFGSLNGLRALSITAVVWLHTAADGFQSPILRRGFLGVDFFFVISGFLIVTLLLRELRQDGIVSLANFYVRRSLRILPIYWIMLVFAFCVVIVKPGTQAAAIKHDLPYAFFYVSNLVQMFSFLSITWSLSTEEQFYFIIPWLMTKIPRTFPWIFLPSAYLLAVIPPFGVFDSIRMPEFFRQTTFGPILLGVILAYVLDSERGWSLIDKILGNKWSPVFALALLALTISISRADIAGWPRLVMQLSMLVVLASCVVRERHVLLPALCWWPLRRIGIVSYGIYIYHLQIYWPIAKLLGQLKIQSSVSFFIADMVCTWGVAEISFRFFEARFLALKKKFAAKARFASKSDPDHLRSVEI